MNTKIKLASIAFLILAVLLCISPAAIQAIPMDYTPGDEEAIFGHTFTESHWQNDSIYIKDPDTNDTVQLIMSYVNYEGIGSFQAALLSLGMVHDYDEDKNATLPYQLFGMHFTTPEGKDVFIGAVLAFMYGWNDTNHNDFPNDGEDLFFLVPYGFNGTNTNQEPSVSARPLIADPINGHYQFGVTYENMMLRVVPVTNNPLIFWAFLLAPIFEFEISELTFIYDINVNTTTGEITAETFYEIGQVSVFRFLTIPVPNPQQYMDDLGIGVTHFIAYFNSNYLVEEGTTDPQPAADWITANITADGERAFAIGVRGDYDQINETSSEVLGNDLPAYSWLLTPKPEDLFLVRWQLGFSAYFLSVFAYAMSPTLQDLYDNPADVMEHADTAFTGNALWYGIAFSEWEGYRIEHDPVYTAYSNIGQIPTGPGIPGFPIEAILIGLVTSLLLVFVVRRRKFKSP